MSYRLSSGNRFFCFALAAYVLIFKCSLVPGQSEEQNAAQPPTFRLPYFGEVAGRVVDADGKPVVDATVIYRGNPLPGRPDSNKFQTSTNSDGKFSFQADLAMRSRQVSITVVHPDYAIAFEYSSSFGLDRNWNDLDIRLREGITIGGRIVDVDGKPVPEAAVSLYAPYDRHFESKHSTGETDATGHFAIEHAPDRPSLSLHLYKKGVVQQSLTWLSKSAVMPVQSRYPDDGMITIGGNVYFRDGSTYQLPGKFRAKLTARDSRIGQPVTLKWAACALLPHGSIFRRPEFAYQLYGNLESEFTFINIGYGPYRFYCEPDRSSGLLGGFIDEAFHKKSTDLIKKLEFVPGANVRGVVVDQSTSTPIPNVEIRYRPANIEEFEQKGILPQFSTNTSEDGTFKILVPHGPGVLTMVGEVPSYVTVPSTKDPLPPQLQKRFSKRISPELDKHVPDIRFQLAPSPVVRALVLGPDDNPLAGVSYVATHFREENKRGTFIGGRTNRHGRLEINSMFDDATFPYDQPPKRIQERIRRGQAVGDLERHIKRNQIWCWTDDNSLCGSIVVHREDAGEDLIIKLTTAATITGRIVDNATGQALPGVPITVFCELRPVGRDFRWSTKTNQVGAFTVNDLFPEKNYEISVSQKDYQFEAATIATTNLAEPLDLGDIGGTNIAILNKPIEVIDVSQLPDNEALGKIVEFVKKTMEDSPPAPPNSWSNAQPAAQFRKKLATAIAPQMKLLAARHPNSDYHCDVYLKVFDEIKGDARSPLPSRIEWIDQARLDLIKNIDREGVFEAYKRINWSLSGTMFESAIMKQSKKREIRAWAYRSLLQDYSYELAFACKNTMYTAKQFEAKLKQVEKFWQQGIDEFGDVALPAPPGTTMERYVHTMIKRISDKVQKDSDYEKSRVKRVLELAKKFAPKKKI